VITPTLDARAHVADVQRFTAGLVRDMAHAGWMPESGVYACGCPSSVPPPLLDDADDNLGPEEMDPLADVHDTNPAPPPTMDPV
jgi:hypothetical protein